MAIPGNFLSAATESMDPSPSGWRVRANCTMTSTTGGRNGPKAMLMMSVAAGEMQTETVTGYPVVPGETYYTFADTASSTQPERIGLEWLDAAHVPVGSITWSLTTAAASISWHRVSVAGVAPAGATRVRVVLSAVAGAASRLAYWENVYLGLPVRTQGSLLPFNVASGGELDLSGWEAESNASLSRQAPMVAWGSTTYSAGGHVVAVTAVVGGNCAARSASPRPTAVPGVQYGASVYLNPPTSASVAWVELRFHDAAGTVLLASRGVLAAPGTSWYLQTASAFAPAGTQTVSIAVGMTAPTAGQVLRVDGADILIVTSWHAGNVVPLADGSFEQSAAGWTVPSGVAAIARSTPHGASGFHGPYSLVVTSSTATVSTLRSAKFPIGTGMAGAGFRQEVVASVTAGGWTCDHRVRWYDATNTEVGLTASGVTPLPTPGWWVIAADHVVPAGATQAAVEYVLTATAASSTLLMDRVSLWETLPVSAVEADTDRGGITLTQRELTVGRLLTVYRVAADGSRALVRGPGGLFELTPIISDLMVIEDYEAPLGVPVSYYVEQLAVGATVPSSRGSELVTIDPGDPNTAWLKDPGMPQRNLRVMVERPPDWTRPIEQAAFRVKGRRNTVTLSDVRGGLEGDLTIWTRDDEERAALHWLLGSGNTLLWQAAPGMGVDDMYVAVGQAAEARVTTYAPELWRAWSLPMVQADMPTAVGVGGTSGRTWQDVASEFASWDAVFAAYATWEDVLLDRRR